MRTRCERMRPMNPSAAAVCCAMRNFVGSPKFIDGPASTSTYKMQVFFFQEEFDEQPIEPRVEIPIDEPQIVALRVVAIVGELDAATLARTASLPFEPAEKNLAAHQVERLEPGKQFGSEQRVGRHRDGDRVHGWTGMLRLLRVYAGRGLVYSSRRISVLRRCGRRRMRPHGNRLVARLIDFVGGDIVV